MAKDKEKKKKSSSNAPDTEDISNRIKPVADVKYGTTCIFYGRSGSGKTTLASTFPIPILHIDIKDKGTDSIVDVEGVETILVEEWSDIEDLYWFLASKQGKKYKTVILDTISQMQVLAVSEAKRQQGRAEDAPMSQQLWGTVSGLMTQWLLSFRDLSHLNVVFIAQDRQREADEDADDDQIMPSVGPQLMPSVAKNVMAAVNVVGHTYIQMKTKQVKGKIRKRSEYHLRLGPHPIYNTKIRSPRGSKVPDSVKNPTYDLLMEVIEGTYAAKEDE